VSAIGWDNPWVGDSRIPWRNTTHDWANSVDAGHLAEVRQRPARFAPGGILHLILEAIAYAADEAESTATGRCVVTLHNDGSVSVADNGRGTDTRYDEQGQSILLPIPDNDTTGTTVRFLPDAALSTSALASAAELVQLTLTTWPHLTVEILDERSI
jgi:DNA gyrase/topoisomerase IV subunit B